MLALYRHRYLCVECACDCADHRPSLAQAGHVGHRRRRAQVDVQELRGSSLGVLDVRVEQRERQELLVQL